MEKRVKKSERKAEKRQFDKKAYYKKRDELKELSSQLKSAALMMGEEDVQVNELLVNYYQKKGYKDLRTFDQWRKEGYFVKKGQTGICIWGKPVAVAIDQKDTKNSKEQTEDQSTKGYFPLSYLFDITQVKKTDSGN